jgi:predicted lipoprotein with Yx(FWY)xxD motif
MKPRLRISLALVAFSIIVLESACSKSSSYNSNPPAQPVVKEITLQSSATLGNYLVDKDGRALYFFASDADGKNHCTGGCAAVWPVFNVDNISSDKLGTGLNGSDFSQITTPAGTKQVTYKGWPLYYFAPLTNGTNTPEQPGQTTGDNVNGVFFVGKPDYTIMITKSQLLGLDGKNYKSDFTQGDETTTHFTDGNGHTLYTFSLDRSNKNNWTTADFSNNSIWPIYETDKIVVPSALDKTKFGSITVFGKKQLTYKGWPLYYFGQDGNTRGLSKGVSFPQPGVWPVAATTIQVAQ